MTFCPTYWNASCGWRNVSSERCALCLTTTRRGVMTTIYGLPPYDRAGDGNYSETFICEDCCDWNWISLSQAIEGYSMMTPASTEDWWPEWMLGLPDEHCDFEVGIDSPWFQLALKNHGEMVMPYLSGDIDSHVTPF